MKIPLALTGGSTSRLKIPLRRTMKPSFGGGGGGTIADIIGLVDYGVWNDLTRLKQNHDGTGAVANDDDPVGFWRGQLDVLTFIQPSAGNRLWYGLPPTLSTESDRGIQMGNPWVGTHAWMYAARNFTPATDGYTLAERFIDCQERYSEARHGGFGLKPGSGWADTTWWGWVGWTTSASARAAICGGTGTTIPLTGYEADHTIIMSRPTGPGTAQTTYQDNDAPITTAENTATACTHIVINATANTGGGGNFAWGCRKGWAVFSVEISEADRAIVKAFLEALP